MRLSHFFFYSLLLTCTFSSCSHDDGNDNGGNGNSGGSTVHANVNANPTTNPAYSLLEFPHVKGGNSMVIVHQAVLNSKTNLSGVNYSVEWDCNKKAQRWSCYEMYESIKASNTSRYYSDTDQYPQDQSIPSQYRFASDPFWGTGFNHGHICPSADRLGSADANYQTFFLSNMQPQWYAFNGGIWEKMENQVRSWNKYSFRDTLYVCKGGTIDNSDQIIRKTSSGLIVPKYFFMAILCKNSQGYKALAFWVEQTNADHSNDKLIDYVISIDELEKKTGIDFFCNLPDDKENAVESNVYPAAWGLQ
jgi:endonuclease G